jgi:hypothetical protein
MFVAQFAGYLLLLAMQHFVASFSQRNPFWLTSRGTSCSQRFAYKPCRLTTSADHVVSGIM